MEKKFMTSPDDEERKKYTSTWGDLMEPNFFTIRGGDMANVKLTCGHWITPYEEPVLLSIKDYSRTGEKTCSFGSYCKKCAEQYEKEGLVLHSEAEVKEWFN